ncbi:uncharacterized protein LOC111479231 [Cucurbita maxima]|uniref:Uncharacterized protein LOC111479231 n=1 Tax=Cucurbita maxima TaxID=3661 RepID=A0A6J1IWY2_CUCMA|nr:uncharacterized protein LOC111479231 [Cucurbita maxima]
MATIEKCKSKPRFFDRIFPPRPVGAGLDDSAPPPNSICQAFFKVASTVKSRAAALLVPLDAGCVYDPWGDAVDGLTCTTQMGLTLPEFDRDAIVIGGMEMRRWKPCVVDGFEGFEGFEVGDEAEKEQPILLQGFA